MARWVWFGFTTQVLRAPIVNLRATRLKRLGSSNWQLCSCHTPSCGVNRTTLLSRAGCPSLSQFLYDSPRQNLTECGTARFLLKRAFSTRGKSLLCSKRNRCSWVAYWLSKPRFTSANSRSVRTRVTSSSLLTGFVIKSFVPHSTARS